MNEKAERGLQFMRSDDGLITVDSRQAQVDYDGIHLLHLQYFQTLFPGFRSTHEKSFVLEKGDQTFQKAEFVIND